MENFIFWAVDANAKWILAEVLIFSVATHDGFKMYECIDIFYTLNL